MEERTLQIQDEVERHDDILSLSASPGPLTDEEVLYITKLDLVTLQTNRHMFSYLYSMTNCPSSLLTGKARFKTRQLHETLRYMDYVLMP